MDAGDVSEGLWGTERLRRSSARRGELGSVVFVEIRFQREARKAAGGAPGVGIFQVTSRSSICFGIKGETRSGRSCRSWGKDWEKEEGADLLGSVGFDRDVRRSGGIPTSYSGSLGARFGRGRKGKWRGEMELLIGMVGARIGQELMRIEEREGVTAGEETVVGVVNAR
jgi:hypothetical protein